MAKILQHVIYWTDQSFTYPRPASAVLKTWDWVEQIRTYVFTNSPLEEGAQRPWRFTDGPTSEDDIRVVNSSLSDHIQSFMDELWEYVSKEPLWRDPTVVTKQVRIYLRE